MTPATGRRGPDVIAPQPHDPQPPACRSDSAREGCEPPEGLTAVSARLWRAVTADYVLSEAELELLRQACLSLDRADQAAAIVAEVGPVSVDRYGSPKAHPAVDIEARSRALFARLVAQLGVKAEPTTTPRTGARPGPRTPRRS